ncbi:hypothetical protein bcgnr5379_62910 [Bacillus cereus]
MARSRTSEGRSHALVSPRVFTDSSQDGAQTRQTIAAFFADGVVVARVPAAARKCPGRD